MKKVNILVVDDHQQILEAIRNALQDHPGVGSIDVFGDGLSVCSKLNERQYDIYIIDLRLPHMDGFALIGQIRQMHPGARIIINTMCEELWDAKRILELDVDGIVIKTSSLTHLKEAVDKVMDGQKYYCLKFRHLKKQQETGAFLNISKRELAVLHGIAEGMTTAEISLQIDICENTVESIRKRLLVKMDVRNMAQLIAKAYKTGILDHYCTTSAPD